MEVKIYSRRTISELIKTGFPQGMAVISFYTPRRQKNREEFRVEYQGVCDKVFYVGIPDIDVARKG